MKILLKKAGVVAAVGLAATLQACSSGDSIVQELDPGSTGANLSGSAVKGVFANADCIVKTVSGLELYSSVPLSTPCTDSKGNYSIKLKFTTTEPVVLTLQPRAGTTMKCDLPAGCSNGVDFGENVELSGLGDDFSMRALVTNVSDTISSSTVNVSPWSDLAVDFAEKNAEGGNLANVSVNNVTDSYERVANLLNNMLGLEGDASAFTSDFASVPLSDLTAPSSTDVGTTDATKKRQAVLLSLASGSLLSLTDSSTTVSAGLAKLKSSFGTDGVIDVNGTASGIAGDAVNLAALVENISTVTSQISSKLSSSALTELSTLLSTDDLTSQLTTIQTTTQTIATNKNAVVDSTLDTTAPKTIISSGLTAYQKLRKSAENFVNILFAVNTGFNTDDGTNTVLEDLNSVFAANTVPYEEGIADMALLMEGAASMILQKANNDISVFTSAGCDPSGVNNEDFQCSAMQLAMTLDDPWNDLMMATGGTIAYTHSNRTVTATGVSKPGYSMSLTMVGNTSTTAPSYTVTSAKVDFSADAGDADIDFGANTVVSGIAATGGAGTSFTISAPAITIDLKQFLFVTKLLVTRNLTIRDTLLTNFLLSGRVLVGTATDDTGVLEANKGKGVNMTIAFKGNTTNLQDTTSLPMPPDELETDFIGATDIELTIGFPVSVRLYTIEGGRASTATNAALSVTFKGKRTSLKNGDVTAMNIKLIGPGVAADFGGDLTASTGGTPRALTTNYTFTDSGSAIAFQLVDTEGTASRALSGTVSTSAGQSAGSINASGTMTVINPDNTSESVAISLPSALLVNSQNSQ